MRRAYDFGGQHYVQDTAIVVHFADAFAFTVALVLVVKESEDVIDGGEIRSSRVEVERLVTGTGVAGRPHIRLRARPPDTDEAIHGITNGGCFLHRGGVHHSPAPH